ncbi:TrkA family potassium uptake protein [Trueperella pecoris]|uniref:Trk system potassium uptake protein TrkA n=1 Tax=Trueperella pecoris TaxID=2733571 RepID=A0A7M1R4Z3_9ACTO|nr:TrkA family potassium uptake protein [Trueperella pecoris]QOR48535.1 TrkA family potassium uptake protein [Trueperella pecoris]
MKILVAGAGSVGRSLAREMSEAGHEVTLIDSKPEAMRVASVPEADWILGDACELTVLETAGLEDTDAVIAATGDDKSNLVLSLLAKTEFGVPNVIARVSNPANTWLFDESWGVDVAVSTPQIMAEIIQEAVSTGKLMRRMQFQSGAAMYLATVPNGSLFTEHALGHVSLPPDILVSSVIRDGVPLFPSPDMAIDAGDQLIFIVGANASDGLSEIEAML